MADQTDEDKEKLKDFEGGYGGGRQRVEQMHEHAFGDRGWGTRGGDDSKAGSSSEGDKPEGVHETRDPQWQEKFADENQDKYGQAGGHPIEQRGPAQSEGGEPEEQGTGDTQDVSSRGAVGIRETENWPEGKRHK